MRKFLNKLTCIALSLTFLMGCMATPAFAYSGEESNKTTTPSIFETEEEPVTITEQNTGPLTPEGNLTVVDDYQTTFSDGTAQQFITLVSKSGAYFYLIIDRAADGDQTAHFLNMVDEADLLALMDEEDIPEPEPEPEEPTDTELLARYIRTRSAQGQLTARKALLEENPEMEPVIDELLQDEAFPDIRTEKGEKDVYYYATPIMAVHYAHLAMLAEEKDLPRTIADMVRHHCKIGPAPTPVTYFTASPYNCTIPQIDRALMTMKHRAEYADIQEVLSYNHVRYLFSSSIISAKYAKSLADFSEESAEIQ